MDAMSTAKPVKGIFLKSPPCLSISRDPVAWSTDPAAKKSVLLKKPWLTTCHKAPPQTEQSDQGIAKADAQVADAKAQGDDSHVLNARISQEPLEVGLRQCPENPKGARKNADRA